MAKVVPVIAVLLVAAFSMAMLMVAYRDHIAGFAFFGATGVSASTTWLVCRVTGRRDEPPDVLDVLIGYPLLLVLQLCFAWFLFGMRGTVLWGVAGMVFGQLTHAVYSGLRDYKSE